MHYVGEILIVQKFAPLAPPPGSWMKYRKVTLFQNL